MLFENYLKKISMIFNIIITTISIIILMMNFSYLKIKSRCKINLIRENLFFKKREYYHNLNLILLKF